MKVFLPNFEVFHEPVVEGGLLWPNDYLRINRSCPPVDNYPPDLQEKFVNLGYKIADE